MDDAAARALISRTLEPGEQIVWSQAAPWGPTLISNGLMVLLFAAFIAAFAWFGRKSLLELFRTGEWWRRALVGVFFAMMGLGLIVGVSQSASSFATAYGVTDRRVIVAAQGAWLQTWSYDADSLATRVDVVGDQIDIVRETRRHGFWQPLFGVRDAARVGELVRERVRPMPATQPSAPPA